MPKFLKLVLFYTCMQLVGVACLVAVVVGLAHLITKYQGVAVTVLVVLFVVLPIVALALIKAHMQVSKENNNVRK